MNGRREKQNTRRPPVILLLLLAAALLLPAGCGAPADPAPGYRQISQDEAARMMAEEPDCLIVDVRTPEEYAQVRIPGAVNVPNETIGDGMPEALPDRDQVLLVYCRSGRRSKEAARKLADLGYTNVYEFGGIITWPGETVSGPEAPLSADPAPADAPDPPPEPDPAPEDPAPPAEQIDFLVLVDSRHPLPAGWEDALCLVEFTNAVGDRVRVEQTAYAAYLELKAALAEEGVYVDLDSAYRSVAEQQAVVDELTEQYGAAYARTYAAQPGTSEHHTGLALDLFLLVDGGIVYDNEDLMKYPELWAKIHARLSRYGFILRHPGGGDYPYEPWHIRYVGTGAAGEMAEKGLSLEEYLNGR